MASTDQVSVCQGDSVFVGGAWQTTPGVYIDIYQAASGCDSTVSTTLTVLPTFAISNQAAICQGDSIFLGGGWQTTAGVYTDTYIASNSCDSTIQTTLTVVPVINSSSSLSICEGDSVILGGIYRSTSGVYVDSLMAVGGCDSVHTTTLAVTQVDTSVTVINNVITANAINATFRWIDCATNSYIIGQTSQSFAPQANGVYAVEVSQNSCVDTSSCIPITTIGMGELSIPNLEYQPNPTAGLVYVNLGGMYHSVRVSIIHTSGQLLASYTYIDVDQLEIDFSDLPAAEYFVQIDADMKQQIIKVVRRK